ncbi:hypothetical protein ACQP2U_42440 (plasmid) [Nocardia sp. CA-084685]|uniref:hypothetical protein n=1 Tax=Nocardia sp. CA-084685 TaxID=3239970 RepID=UPI003D97EE72
MSAFASLDPSDDLFFFDSATLAMRIHGTGLTYDEAARLLIEYNPHRDPGELIDDLDNYIIERHVLYTCKPWTRRFDRGCCFIAEHTAGAAFLLLGIVIMLALLLVVPALTGHLAISGIVLVTTAACWGALDLAAWRRRNLSLRYAPEFLDPGSRAQSIAFAFEQQMRIGRNTSTHRTQNMD